MNLEMSGKRALICGASQGIGAAVAQELALLGAQVHLLARSADKLQSVESRISGDGHGFTAVDFSDREKLEKVLDEVLAEGAIDVLVCNSGGPKGGPIAEANELEFIEGFANHVRVNSLMAKKVLPAMKEKGDGRIINIISTSVKVPIPGLGVSNTIRGAVASWAKTLSLEVAAAGITVNNVLPGFTETPRLQALIEGAAKKTSQSVDEVSQQWRAKVPAARFASPEEVAAAVAFLASPAAAYINGVSLPVDGGRTGCL